MHRASAPTRVHHLLRSHRQRPASKEHGVWILRDPWMYALARANTLTGMSIENLTLGPDPSSRTGRRRSRLIVMVTVAVSVTALAVVGGPARREPGVLGQSPTSPLQVVVVGDVSAGENGCGGCSTYVDQSAVAWAQDGRPPVRVHDHTAAADDAPSMPTLVDRLRYDPDVRAAVSVADVIVLAVGSADVAQAAPARCHAERPSPCPTTISQFRDSLTVWMTETERIRHHRPLTLRIITPPPISGSPRQNDIARSACQVAALHDGICVNVFRLARTDDHLVTGESDSRHPQLTQHGHDLVASHLIALGPT